MLTCHEFTRSGHGLKHIEQYLLELPQMYEKTLGDSSVHCLRPCWHWSVVLSFFYFASSWFLKLVDTHCFGAWRKSQTSCFPVSKVVLWCFLQYSAVSRDAQLCCPTHSTICTTVHGFAPIALLGKTFASFEMETCEYAISQSLVGSDRSKGTFVFSCGLRRSVYYCLWQQKVVRTLASLSPSEWEDRLGVLRKLAKFAAMVHKVAPPVLLLWKRPCRDETADKPRTLRKHFALGRTCSFQTDSDNVIKYMSLHICEFSSWQGVAGGMQGGAGDRQGNAWKPSTRPLSTRTCQKKMRRTCTSRWTHQSFMILLSKYIKIRGADFCSDLGLHPVSTSCNMGPCFWRCGSFQKNENNTNSCPSEQCSPDGPLLRPPLSRTLLVSLAEALHRGGSPQFSSKLFVSPETWSQATSWMHMMTYLHTTHNTHTHNHTHMT